MSNSTLTLPTLPMLPLRELIVFPHMFVPLFVGREKSIQALECGLSQKMDVFLVAQKDATVINPGINDLFEVGTVGSIVQLIKLPDDTVKVLIEGKRRAKLNQLFEAGGFFQATIEDVVENKGSEVESKALIRSIKETFEAFVKVNKRIPPEMLMSITHLDDGGKLSDIISAHLQVKLLDKQALLGAANVTERLELLLNLLQAELEVAQVERKIKFRVKKQVEKNQRDLYLNEQMSAIQKELGEQDEFKAELIEIERQIKTRKLSKEAREKLGRELKKLRMMSPMSAEATVIRNYIEWTLALPWSEMASEKLDINVVESVLTEDHFGLLDVKDRIVEHLAVKQLNKDSKGTILLLVGPPGVGKTSLGRSIARALNRPMVRASLGGVRDEAEIRGHRRTYVGALPGKIIQHLRKAGVSNPVFILDEIDKMSSDVRGDPSSALLEVLDPEQNHNFQDHYLEVEFDLSKIMFIATANNLHSIPRPLLDRMEVVSISGYTQTEKEHIASSYLVPRQVKNAGLDQFGVKFDAKSIEMIIRHYTREAGVRNLEREIGKVCRKVARRYVKSPDIKSFVVTGKNVEEFLGPKKFHTATQKIKDEIGKVNGLAYTEVGGEMLEIEVQVLPGAGKLVVTGKLGEVMQESAQAAMSYVRSRAPMFGLEDNFYAKNDIHIHVPEGAIPKDGPSAGITMATALISALTRTPIRGDVAMTGEITLRGKVMPIGGLKEKLLAAKMSGMKNIIIPIDNVKDLEEIPADIRKGLKIHPVETVDEVWRLALKVAKPEEFFRKKARWDASKPTVRQ